MGTNTIALVGAGAIETDNINQFRTAVTGDFLPRNASTGAIEDNQHSLGVSSTNWKNVYTKNLYINNSLFDPSGTGGEISLLNGVVSCATRTTSEQPDFLRASGAAATVTILGATTPLTYTAFGVSASISSDLPVTSLTVAPASNNTCAVNDTTLTDQDFSKYIGEEGTSIIVDAMGSEISDRIGQYVCLKTPDSEYLMAFVESATKLSRCFRGYFFDSSGAPIPRGTLADNDTLTLMSLGWVFADTNGTTVDVSYKSPTYSAVAPSASPAADDYWFDTVNQKWNRYSGSAWVVVSRVLIGLAVTDGTNCVASRSCDINRGYFDHNTVELELFSVTQIYSKQGRSQISVYGNNLYYDAGSVIWDIATHLETGLTEAASTPYYLYITEAGAVVMSDKRPYDRRSNLKGFYHPHNSWRCVGVAYNDGSSNLIMTSPFNEKTKFLTGGVDWNKLISESEYITYGTTFLNSPLFTINTIGHLKINRVDGQGIVQEWVEGATGETWQRATANGGTTWSMWECLKVLNKERYQSPDESLFVALNATSGATLSTALSSTFSGTSAGVTWNRNSLASKQIPSISCYTGTTTTGYAEVIFNQSCYHDVATNPDACSRWEALVNLGTAASDGTNTYYALFGLMVNATSIRTTNNIVAFSYTNGENAGNWTTLTDKAGTETANDSGVAAKLATVNDIYLNNSQKLRIEVEKNAKIRFYIDDVLVATHTTNIADAFGPSPMLKIIKTAGTAVAYLNIGRPKMQVIGG